MAATCKPGVVDLCGWCCPSEAHGKLGSGLRNAEPNADDANLGHRSSEENDDTDVSSTESISASQGSLDAETAKNTRDKPPFSYVALITMAITNSASGKVTLAEIYDYLTQNFAYFRGRGSTKWMNAVRHNLTLNDCFVNLPRDPLMGGKGGYWCIDPESKGMFNHGSLKRRRSKFKRTRGEIEVVKDIMLKDYIASSRYSPYSKCVKPYVFLKTASPCTAIKEPPTGKQYSNFSIDAILARNTGTKSKHVVRWFGSEVLRC